ncbi:MAG TPA: efflux RND transporter permease subunit [Gemmataceae bacterium]|nr:efflux RND transporter permease subunit [Gemmataceae bacterium]
MFSHFFIERPIFASVMSIVITLAGAVAAFNLPVAQYPQITPPSIMVMCNYPGANAQVVADSIAAPIEQQVNGVEGMMYMVSQSNNDGSYTLTVTFKPGVNLNFAQVLVQNRINLAVPLLPDVVKQAGVTTRKRNPDILQVIAIYSPKGRYDQLYLSNFATIKVVDELRRVEGVGDVLIFGQQDYSMRLWVDPDKLAARGLGAADVARAIREQNMQVAAGHLGQQPVTSGKPFEFTITTLGRLDRAEEFAEIILKVDPSGGKVRLKDVGHVELGAKSLDSTSKLNGRPNGSIAVWALPDANSITVADNIITKMEELKKHFPEDIDYAVSLDMTPFIKESIKEVVRSLIEAIILVAIVVLVFLQNWRSALIPLAAVPVAVIGTFAVMAVIHFSLNNLTLFGLVLAIGIVVDDAIVVVEAVEHHIEHGLTPRQAAHKAMDQVSGPVVAVALVLCAVFVPCAFISGITGEFFRQFALTIAVSTVISAFNSLTLSPALAAILLQPRGARKDVVGRLLDLLLGWFFRLFNWAFRRSTRAYTGIVGLALRGSAVVLLLYGGLLGLTYMGFKGVPGLPKGLLPEHGLAEKWGSWGLTAGLPLGYIPNQDQGRFYIAVQLPDSASLERTQKVTDHIQRAVQPMGGVVHVTQISGQSFTFNANGSNFGQFFIAFDDFDKRADPSLTADAIVARVRGKLEQEIPEAKVALFTPPPVAGLGSASGFKIIIEDRGDLGLPELQQQIERLIERSRKSTKVENLYCIFRADTPQLFMDIERDKCQALGVSPADVFTTLQVYLGSLYVNDFNKFGRTWQVVVQAGGEFRDDPDKVKLLKVKNADGEMVPLGALVTIREIGGPINIGRYNMYPAAAILGATKPGVSSGEGIEEMERLCAEVLSPGMGFEWTEINYMQIDAGKNVWNNLIFPLAVVFVFLVLAAQYESWALPLAVILVVPMCILGSLTGVAATGGDINIFTQIGFVVLVGLASKNAILIVEFAKHKHEEGGLSRREATLEACQLRLRPILMTSFAFILGVVPLLVGRGAGSEMRRQLGVAVFSGMVGVTLFGIFLTPVFFFVIEGLAETPLFASERVRVVGKVLLYLVGILTLGIPWLLVLAVGSALRRRRAAIPATRVVLADGDAANGNGHEKSPNGDGVPAAGADQLMRK